MVRKTLTLISALVALFHIWLLASQVWQGELVDLALVARWVFAGGLIAALGSLRCRGASMFRGRQAVAIWLLAALLHGPAVARDFTVATPALPEVTTTLVQTVTSLTALGVVVLLTLVDIRRRASLSMRRLSPVDVPAFAGVLPPGSFLLQAPRPPPHS